MVEKQPCCFPKVPAQQSMIRKKRSLGSSPLLPAVAGSCAHIQTWPEGGSGEGVREEQAK